MSVPAPILKLIFIIKTNKAEGVSVTMPKN